MFLKAELENENMYYISHFFMKQERKRRYSYVKGKSRDEKEKSLCCQYIISRHKTFRKKFQHRICYNYKLWTIGIFYIMEIVNKEHIYFYTKH